MKCEEKDLERLNNLVADYTFNSRSTNVEFKDYCRCREERFKNSVGTPRIMLLRELIEIGKY